MLGVSAPEQEPAAWPVEICTTWWLPDVRHILIHVLTEVDCHSGHLDAAHEPIDGTVRPGGNPCAGWTRGLGDAPPDVTSQQHVGVTMSSGARCPGGP